MIARVCKYLLVSFLFAVALLCEGQTFVYVDSDAGNDTICCANASFPCMSLSGALGLINASGESSSVVVILSNGVHLLRDELQIQEGVTDVTIEATSTHGAVVRCENERCGISVAGSVNVTITGIVLEHFGPYSVGFSLNGSENLRVYECIFRRNTGAPILAYNVRNVEVSESQFLDNKNLLPATIGDDAMIANDLYATINSGAGLSLFSIGIETEIVVDNCQFHNNTASENHKDDLNQLLFKQNGRGSAILIRLVGVVHSTIKISGCEFSNNHAQIEGAAIYTSFSDNASSNHILLSGNEFTRNTVELGAGGALGLNSFQFSVNNKIDIEDCVFVENRADSGGAVSFALYDSSEESVIQPDQMHFHNCLFQHNAAVHEGTAVGLFSLVHVDDVGFPVNFSNCSFHNNTSLDLTKESSALVVFRFQIALSGYNHFRGNIGGGLELISAFLRAYGTITFEENTAVVGGGITMNDRCLLELSPGVEMSFIGNRAQESGGAFYAEFPLIQFSVTILNRLCFIQYNDDTGKDVPPQDWKDVAINFYNNSAGMSGAAVYASTMHQCTWFGEGVSVGYSDNIFHFPEEIADQSPFHFQGNTLAITSDDVSLLHNPALATAPFQIFTSTDHELVQSGEKLSIELMSSDQVNNSREAVWSLESPDHSTVLDAIGTSGGAYLYDVPSFSHFTEENTSALNMEFSLGFIPLNTLGSKVSIGFETQGCHPGYVYDEDRDTCQCDSGDANIVRCDDSNRYIYLSEGIWGGVQERDGQRALITARVLPGYLECDREGRLPGCRFQFDNINKQCSSGRKGALCGTCKEGYGVTMDLQSCTSSNCATGLTLFLLCCILVVLFSLFILYFNVSLPNELKGFFFYAQVIAVIYRAYIVAKETADTQAALTIMVNMLGYGLPLPLCLSKSLEAHQVAVLAYISPILMISTVVVYTVAARFIRLLGQRSALKGITFLFLIVYKYVADASFILISCTYLDPELVFLYDGSKSCTEWELGILGFISLCVVVLFVVPAPIAVGYICVKHPKKFHQWADVLTNDLRPEQRWWGGWDIGRRLPFVFLGYLLVVTSPSVVLFLMSLTAIVILIVHISALPYMKLHTNIIETLILALLLIINSSFVESSSVSVPEQLISLLIVLPYTYAIGYIAWKIGSFLWVKYVPKEIVIKAKQYYSACLKRTSNIEASSSSMQTAIQNQQFKESVRMQGTDTTDEKSTNLSSSLQQSTDSSSEQQTGEAVRRGLKSNGGGEGQPEEGTAYRETLLDTI